MTKKKTSDTFLLKLGVFVLAVFLIFIAILTRDSATIPNPIRTATPTLYSVISIGDIEIPVEVADTPQERDLGLGYRDSLPENEGMLFDFGTGKTHTRFWMKGMRFPLDIIFIADGKVVQIIEDAQAEPGVADRYLKAYVSNEPVHYVLEVNAGFAQKHSIQVGDDFSF